MARINLPYGIDNFAKVRNSGCYYIDKTGFIKELVSETFDVNLITRPRRFGKTRLLSGLRSRGRGAARSAVFLPRKRAEAHGVGGDSRSDGEHVAVLSMVCAVCASAAGDVQRKTRFGTTKIYVLRFLSGAFRFFGRFVRCSGGD